MKGVIIKCLQDLVETAAAKEKWQSICQEAGVPPGQLLLVGSDIPDTDATALLTATMHQLGLTLEQAADAFGDHWMNEFAPKIYAAYFRAPKNAREFLLAIDDVHLKTSERLTNARPPRFQYRWKDDATLVVTYQSSRGLIDLAVGLARGVGKHFNETLAVKRLSDTEFEVRFPQ